MRVKEKGVDLNTAKLYLRRKFAVATHAAALCITVAAVSLLLAGSAFASEAGQPPEFVHDQNKPVTAFPTSVRVLAEYVDGGLSSEWSAEYAVAEANCEPPNKEAGCSWSIADEFANHRFTNTSKGNSTSDNEIWIGVPLRFGSTVIEEKNYLGHLKPATRYYARFIARNGKGEARETVGFTTLPPAKPELHKNYNESARLGVFQGGPISDTAARFELVLESNGSETSYNVEYALPESGHAPTASSPAWQPFTTGASGIITVAEEHALIEPEVTGLSPETTYYVRVRAANATGELVQTTYASEGKEVSTFTTPTGKPIVGVPEARNVTASSAYATTQIAPDGSQTVWRLESAPSASGPWTVVPGGSGTISPAQAEATPYGSYYAVFGARLTGLSPSTVYYVRAVAENICATGCGTTISSVESFETSGGPSARAFSVHALRGESLRLLGSVDSHSLVTSAEQVITLSEAGGGTFTLTFKGQSTEAIPYNASAEVIYHALNKLPNTEADKGSVFVNGPPGGPYTVFFTGEYAGKPQPPIEASGLGLAPPGTVSVMTSQPGGEAYDVHYRFQYVGEKGFAESGWTGAVESPEIDLGPGTGAQSVGYDLPSLAPGETYRYRLLATSTAPGTSLVESDEHSLVVPAPPSGDPGGLCPNEAFRSGPSAHLPDCRAYELLSPADKEGAQELFHYKQGTASAYVEVDPEGQRVAVEATGVNWGKTGQGPYLFSRQLGTGWLMTTGSPQPQTGEYVGHPELYRADLTQLAFTSQYTTSPSKESANIEYKLGPVGGPYTTVASVPRQDMVTASGWAAANADFSKLVLASADRTLLGEEGTGTKSGNDLYEYTAQSGLRQLNVGGEAEATIGRCGAQMVRGDESGGFASTSHSISPDGTRVFFEAIPGSVCSAPTHLYMRVNGESTIDLGAYKFVAANAEGTRLLLTDEAGKLVGYDTESATFEGQPSGEEEETRELASLGISLPTRPEGASAFSHPRYAYFVGSVPGLPGSGVIRYDSVEKVVECVSCASPFDPEPTQPMFLTGGSSGGLPNLAGGFPEYTATSKNGDFAFFSTPAALLPQDVNGEIELELNHINAEYFDGSNAVTPSSDIYEWRRAGVDGCTHLQGCLALITDGRAGYHNLLLGSAEEGRDVFIYTRSRLLPQDVDDAGDVYDARVGGGFSPPTPRAVECEGDACSSPPSPPNDVTPSSQTFSGAGNVVSGTHKTSVSKSKKPKKPKHESKHRKTLKRKGRSKASRRNK